MRILELSNLLTRFLQLAKVSKASFSKRHFVIVLWVLVVFEYLAFNLHFLQLSGKILKLFLAILVTRWLLLGDWLHCFVHISCISLLSFFVLFLYVYRTGSLLLLSIFFPCWREAVVINWAPPRARVKAHILLAIAIVLVAISPWADFWRVRVLSFKLDFGVADIECYFFFVRNMIEYNRRVRNLVFLELVNFVA